MVGRVLAALLLFCTLLNSQTSPKIGQPAPDFTLADSTGAPVKLSALNGKVVLLDFWATWCHGCQTEIPWYMEFQNKYAKDGLAAVGVSMDEDGWKAVKPYLRDHKLNYPVVVATKDVANEYGGLPSLPVTLLIDRSGKIAEVHAGMVEKSEFETRIKQLLQKGSGT